MTRNIAPETVPDPLRALDALDRALVCAQRGSPDRPLILVHRDDFLVANQSQRSDLRGRLDAVLMGNDPESGLDALLTCGALDALLPEVKALVGFGDGEWRHKDVWKHTRQVVRQAVPRTEVRWAALLHDIGKVRTRSISPEGEVHFFGHAEVGARMFDKLDRRTGLFSGDDPLRNTVRFLILHHLRAAAYEPSWTDSAVRRWIRRVTRERMDDLYALCRADVLGKGRPAPDEIERVEQLRARAARILEAGDALSTKALVLNGNDLMRELDLRPGRHIGQLLDALLEKVIDDPSLNTREQLLALARSQLTAEA